ncbi:MAG: nicotinamide mononucleotide transporter [Saprospiraceae bacterium]|nr:nicotinamide mononucleotide transporter [Saprospiraceae bacterium]
MDLTLILEIFAAITGLVYIILLIRENIWCWFFGIISSIAFIFLMYQSQLYSESILYFFYVFVGFYGFYKWKDRGKNKVVIQRTSWLNIILLLLSGICLSFGIGYLFDSHSDAQRPFADATTSVFSVLASFMEAHKWLSAWVFWIIINLVSIWLYFDRSLSIASFLMVIYFLLSIFGFLHWRKKMQLSAANA